VQADTQASRRNRPGDSGTTRILTHANPSGAGSRSGDKATQLGRHHSRPSPCGHRCKASASAHSSTLPRCYPVRARGWRTSTRWSPSTGLSITHVCCALLCGWVCGSACPLCVFVSRALAHKDDAAFMEALHNSDTEPGTSSESDSGSDEVTSSPRVSASPTPTPTHAAHVGGEDMAFAPSAHDCGVSLVEWHANGDVIVSGDEVRRCFVSLRCGVGCFVCGAH